MKDNRIWEFKLRQGVKHHDGTPVTAEDVKYSLDIYRQDGSPRKANTVGITNVEAVDPQTVRITTDGPRPGLMANLSLLLILPKKAREKMGADEFGKKPVGNGPYKFVEFVRGQRLVLEANPDYYRGRVQPSRLVLRPIADPATRVAELKTGGVQIIQEPSLAQLKELQNDPNTELKLLKGGRLIIHPFNTTEPPFDDVRVRQAANYAVDRTSILQRVLENYGELLHGPFTSAWPGYDPNLKPYPYNPAKAKQLLTEAGYLERDRGDVQHNQRRVPKGPRYCRGDSQPTGRGGHQGAASADRARHAADHLVGGRFQRDHLGGLGHRRRSGRDARLDAVQSQGSQAR